MKVLPPDLCYATVRKRREKGRVVEVVRTLVFGTLALLPVLLGRSTASTTINTSFVERHNGTDRHQNSRKRRKTHGFSKAIERAPRGVVLHRVQLQLLLACADLRVLSKDGSLATSHPGDGRWTDRSRVEPLGVDHVSGQTPVAIPRHHRISGSHAFSLVK